MANVKALQTKKARLELNLVNFEKDATEKVEKLQTAHEEKVAGLRQKAEDAIVKLDEALVTAKEKASGSAEKKAKIEAELVITNNALAEEVAVLKAQIEAIEGVTDDTPDQGNDEEAGEVSL